MWSIDVSPHRAIGSTSATDFVVSLPAVDRSSTRVISEVPLQTNRVDSPFGGPSLDPGALRGTLVPSCQVLTQCSWYVCLVGFGGSSWTFPVWCQNFPRDQRNLLMEKCGAVKFLLLLIYYVNVLHVRDTTRRLMVRMIWLVCSVGVEMISFFPTFSRLLAAYSPHALLNFIWFVVSALVAV